ncbi:MAG: phosphoribosylanthranilate isomerase [Solirubrobacterales bacterium]
MTKVKICGITCLEDALAVRECGAWAIGFVFAPSRRRSSPEAAAAISRAAGSSIRKVGVFANEHPDQVRFVARTCGLDMVQLHGDEPPEYLDRLKLPAIKAFSPAGPVDPAAVERWRAEAYLFDAAGSAAQRGGSGRSFPWEWLQPLAGMDKIILAGGLNPDNIAAAIQAVRPMAVDIASGVEFPEGGKDPNRIKTLIMRVKEADQLCTLI